MPDDRPVSPERCNRCGGSGRNRGRTCGICRGSGTTAALSTPAGPSPRCPDCGGSGEKPVGVDQDFDTGAWDCDDVIPCPRCSAPFPREEAVGAAAKALDAARQVTALLSGHPGQWTLDGYGITDDAASELLSLHDFLNDVDRLSAARPSSPTPEETPERAVLAQMHDTLRMVLAVVSMDEPYPWEPGGALKQQIREDLTAYDALGLDLGDDATTKEGR